MNNLSLFAAVFLILSSLIGLATSVTTTSPSKAIHTMSPNPEPYQVVYDDGTKSPLLQLRVEGDVSSSAPLIYEETLDGFTVKLNKRTKKYTYLNVDLATGDMIETDLIAGEDDPYLYKVAKNAAKQGQQIKDALPKIFKSNGDEGHNRRKLERQNERRTRVTSGVLKNIVIPFKFADHSSRNVPSKSDLHTLMNNVGSHSLCPTGSVRDHYLQTSFNNLDLQSTVADWVTIDYTEAFCANGVSGLTSKIHICIKNALDKAVESGVNFGNFDLDNDGFVDGITFFHSGYAAEWGGVDASGNPYSDRIWSHKWSMYTQPFINNGVKVYEYHINPAMWGISGSNIGRIGVVTHELGHFLGLPDLYDYGDAVYGNGEGIGSYGLMANSWGFDYTQQYPPLMSAWSKYKLGWVTPTEVSKSGSYSLGQSCNNDEMIIIKEGYPSGEYLLIENRQSCGFDAAMPSRYGGLAIFHIDENGNNILGHPDQTGWPSNGNHYKVSLLQADGNYGLEKSWNRGDSGDLFRGGFVDSIGPQGTSTGASYPNTKSYQNGNVKNTGVSISNISPPNAKMTFDVTIGSPPSLSCTDSPYKLKINLGGGKRVTQTCSWVAVSPSSRCALAGVSKACPSTCGSCDTCADAPMKFRMPVYVNGQKKMQFKNCSWVRKQRNNRCKMAGVKATCRQICGSC